MGNTHGITPKKIWEYAVRELTSAENITSDGNPIDQNKIAYLDASISSRSSHSVADIWSYDYKYAYIIPKIERSNTIQVSADTERSTTSITGEVLKKVRLGVIGQVKITFEYKVSVGGNNCAIVLEKNGETIDSFICSNSSYQTRTINDETTDVGTIYTLTGASGDGSTAVYVKNFRIRYTILTENEVLID